MSTGKTERIGLNQWEPEDDFVRTEFNADNEKIDAEFTAVYAALEEETARLDAAMESESARVDTALSGKQAKITASGILKGNGSGGVSAATAGTDYVVPSGSITGNAGSATKLATARTIRTNLASASTASFNGTANVTPGVTGTLPVGNGGTGVTTLAALLNALNGIGAVKIEAGSYTGTGTYGESNPNSLTFGFAPKLVMVFTAGGALCGTPDSGTNVIQGAAVCYMPAMSETFAANSPWRVRTIANSTTYYNYGKRSSDGKTLYWYHTRNAAYQMNDSGAVFYYVAMG